MASLVVLDQVGHEMVIGRLTDLEMLDVATGKARVIWFVRVEEIAQKRCGYIVIVGGACWERERNRGSEWLEREMKGSSEEIESISCIASHLVGDVMRASIFETTDGRSRGYGCVPLSSSPLWPLFVLRCSHFGFLFGILVSNDADWWPHSSWRDAAYRLPLVNELGFELGVKLGMGPNFPR